MENSKKKEKKDKKKEKSKDVRKKEKKEQMMKNLESNDDITEKLTIYFALKRKYQDKLNKVKKDSKLKCILCENADSQTVFNMDVKDNKRIYTAECGPSCKNKIIIELQIFLDIYEKRKENITEIDSIKKNIIKNKNDFIYLGNNSGTFEESFNYNSELMNKSLINQSYISENIKLVSDNKNNIIYNKKKEINDHINNIKLYSGDYRESKNTDFIKSIVNENINVINIQKEINDVKYETRYVTLNDKNDVYTLEQIENIKTNYVYPLYK